MKQFRKKFGKWHNRFAATFGLAAGAAFIPDVAKAELVEVATQSYTRLDDGSLQVTFVNGRSIIVPDGDWTLVNGRVFIESAAVSLSGVGLSSSAAGSSGTVPFLGMEVTPMNIALGGFALGVLASDYKSDSSSSDPDTIEVSGVALTGEIRNSEPEDDDAGVAVKDASGKRLDLGDLFTGSQGVERYTIVVRDGSDDDVSNLFYVDGSAIKIRSDPGATLNDTYTIEVTGVDTYNDKAAVANAYVTLDVDSELSAESDIEDTTINETAQSRQVIVEDLSRYFSDFEGDDSYEVEVRNEDGEVLLNVLEVSNGELSLDSFSSGGFDEFVEDLSGSDTDEHIVLTVSITAVDTTDSPAGTKVKRVSLQDFKLTLDATSINDAPEIKAGESSPGTIKTIKGTSTLLDHTTLAVGADLFDFAEIVVDDDIDENDVLLWSLSGDDSTKYSITDDGLLEVKAVPTAATTDSIDVVVSDGEDTLTIPITIEIA